MVPSHFNLHFFGPRWLSFYFLLIPFLWLWRPCEYLPCYTIDETPRVQLVSSGHTYTLWYLSGYVVLFFASWFVYMQKLTQLIYKGSCLLQQHSVHSLNRVWLSVTPWAAARQASLSITNSWSLLKLMSIESVTPSNHCILGRLLLLPSILPSIRVFSNESVLRIRWPKISASVLPMNIQD